LRTGPRGFDAIANDLLELHNLVSGLAVDRIEFRGLLVLEQGRIELILLLELARVIEVRVRRAQHRPLQRKSILRPVWIGKDRLPVVRDGRIPVAHSGASLASPEGPASRAAGE